MNVENIIKKDLLESNLQFISVFIALYENFADHITSRVKSFFQTASRRVDTEATFISNIERLYQEREGDFIHYYDDKYKEGIINRKFKGKQNPLLATMMWYVENGAISEDDYELFLRIRKLRTKYVHEMVNVIIVGVSETEIQVLVELMALYSKMDKWWICEIEIPTSDRAGEEYDADGVKSGSFLMFQVILEILYGNKEEEYQKVYETVFGKNKEETTHE